MKKSLRVVLLHLYILTFLSENTVHSTSNCSCFDCIQQDLCPSSTQVEVTTKLILHLLSNYQLVAPSEVDAIQGNISTVLQDACEVRKAEYMIAYMFDLPEPAYTSECIQNTTCSNHQCYKNLPNMNSWMQFHSACKSDNDFFAEKVALHDAMEMFKNVLLKKIRNIQWHTSSDAIHVECSQFIQRAYPSCPTQKRFSSADIISIFVKLSKNVFCTSTGYEQHDSFPGSCNNDIDLFKYRDALAHEEVPGVYKGWMSIPVPTLSSIVNKKMNILFHLKLVISAHQMVRNESCLQEADFSIKEKCGVFYDQYHVEKVQLISKLQKDILDCKSCSNEQNSYYSANETCTAEYLARETSSYATRQYSMKMTYVSLMKCSPFDIECVERRLRETPPQLLHLMFDLMRVFALCENCTLEKNCSYTDPCDTKIILENANKYLELPALISASQWCLMDREQLISGHTSIHKMMKTSIGLTEASLVMKIIRLIMSASEQDQENTFANILTKQTSKCESVDELTTLECKSFAVKLHVGLYLRILSAMWNCDEQFSCQTVGLDPFKSSHPMFDNGTGELSYQYAKNFLLINDLTSIFFHGCGSTSDPFVQATMKCSLYASLLDVQQSKIFGQIEALNNFKYLKTTEPSLFTTDAEGISMIEKLFQINRCGDRCPTGYAYCYSKKNCIPDWMLCSQNPYQLDHVNLPRMYTYNLTSTPWPVSTFSPGNITILNRQTDYQEDGSWEYNTDGNWMKLSLFYLETGVKLSSRSLIRYRQTKNNYGFRMLYYYRDYSNSKIGGNTKPQYENHIKIAILLIHPVPVKSNFTVFAMNRIYTILEDEYWNEGIPPEEFVHIHTPAKRNLNPIPTEYRDMIPSNEIMAFYKNVERFEMSRPVAFVRNALYQAGSMELEVKTTNGLQNSFSSTSGLSLDYDNSRLVFRPSHNYFGNLTVYIDVCDCLAESGYTTLKTVEVNIEILPVNDAPEYGKELLLLPSIPCNLTTHPNEGFFISELVLDNDIFDAEQGTNIGVVLFMVAIRNGFGKWQFQLENGSWIDFFADSSFDPFKFYYFGLDTKLRTHYLQADQKIRFLLYNDELWTYSMAMERAFLIFSFWDHTDGISPGAHTITYEFFAKSQAYSRLIFGIQLREDCNGKPGSVAQYDQCGVCGGNGRSCVGCDGVMNSIASTDQCGNCTGGSTGLIFNNDCAATCGKSEIGDCNICQLKKKKRNFKDCHGTCFGKAKINKCGVCSGGLTGKREFHHMDVCGVCHGDGSTCIGCDGVANSGKMLDLCGNCLNQSDAQFDQTCVKVSMISPRSASTDGDEEVTVYGTGFDSKNIYCSFVDATHDYDTHFVAESNTRKQFKITTKKMDAGIYNFQCFINDVKHEIQNFRVYELSTVDVISITPSRIPINKDANVTVHGLSFISTGEVTCVSRLSNKLVRVTGVYVNSTCVKCPVKATTRSVEVELTVIFTDRDISESEYTRFAKASFTIYAPAPHLTFAAISSSYRYIYLSFLESAWTSKKECKELFSEVSLAALGTNFRCVFQGAREFRIYLGIGATIKPGQNLALLTNTFKARFQIIGDYMPATDINLDGPEEDIVPVAVISGSSKYNICFELKLSGRQSRGGIGRPLRYVWTIDFADDVNVGLLSTKVTDGLVVLRSKLSSMPSSRNTIIFSDYRYDDGFYGNIAYNFSLSVINFLDVKSETDSLVVKTVYTYFPQLRILGGKYQRIKTQNLNKIQGWSRYIPCSATGGLRFHWDINDASIQLDADSKSSANLYIYPHTLLGGETYALTLLVSIKDDPTMFVSETVQLEVISSPLIVEIKGGNRVINSQEDFLLDGSLSNDPDKSTNQEWFEWICYDAHGYACFILDVNNTDQYVRMQLPASKKVTVEGRLLDTNQTYQFVLKYFKGIRTQSKSVNITLVPGNPPEVKIFPQKNTKENTKTAIMIRSQVINPSGNTRIWVECLSTDESAYVNLTETGVLLTPIEVYQTRGGTYPFEMVFNNGALEGGVMYKFIIYAESSDGIGSSEVILETNAPPSIGTFVSDPMNGTALLTNFTLNSAEGWEVDSDDLPLTYNYGFYAKEGHKHYLGVPSYESEVRIKLPSGNTTTNGSLDLFVEVADINGATSEAFLTVSVLPPASMDTSPIQNMKSSIDEALAADDLSSALGAISSTVTTFQETTPVVGNGNMTDLELEKVTEIADTFLKFKESVTKSVLTMTDKKVKDVKTQNNVLQSISETTVGSKNFGYTTRLQVASVMSKIVKEQVGGISKRKRRSTDDASSDEKTPEEVETILKTFENIITPSAIDNTTMLIKKTLTDLTTILLAAMCKNIAFHQPAVAAQSDLAEIQAVKDSFDNVSNTSISLGSGSLGNIPAKIVFGEELETLFNSWLCEAENCSGTCIGSVRYKNDLFSNNTNRRYSADIVSVQLYNPETYAPLTVGSLSSPVKVEIPLHKNSDDDNFKYECYMWDAVTQDWLNNSCTSSNEIILLDGKQHAVCRCSNLGIISVIQTVLPFGNTSVERAVPSRVATVAIKFLNDYDNVVARVSKNGMEASIKASLISMLNIDDWRIRNVNASSNGSSSILVTFEFLPPDENVVPNALDIFNEQLELIETLIKNGSLVVQLSDETYLTTDIRHFDKQVEDTTFEKTTPKDLKSLTPLFVILGIIGGMVLIAAVIFIFIKFKVVSTPSDV